MEISSNDLILNNFSYLLKKFREEKKITQSELAEKVGLSLRTYQRIENGESEPSLGVFYRLSIELGINIHSLFNFGENLELEKKLLWAATKSIEKLAEVAKIGVWSYDVQNDKMYWSDVVYQIIQPPEGYIPTFEGCFDFFRGQNLLIIRDAVYSCLSKGIAFKHEVEAVNSKGEILDVVSQGVADIEDGKIVRIHGTFQDISAHRKVVHELERSLTETQAIMQFVRLGRWEYDHEGDSFLWSLEQYQIFEVKKEDFKHNYDDFFSRIHPEDRERVSLACEKSFRSKEAYQIEYRIILPNDGVRWVRMYCKTDFNREGTPIKSYGYTLDISCSR